MWITFKPLSTAIDSRRCPGETERVAEPGDVPLMPLFMIWYHALIGQMSSVMLTDSRCCWQYRALSRSRSYNSEKDFFNTDFEQAIQISLRGFSLIPRLQEEQKKICLWSVAKRRSSIQSMARAFLILSFHKLWSHLQSNRLINRRSKGTGL